MYVHEWYMFLLPVIDGKDIIWRIVHLVVYPETVIWDSGDHELLNVTQ